MAATKETTPGFEEVIYHQCDCKKCASLCQNAPGWMLPAEAAAAIDAGLAKRLMRDWWVHGSDDNTYLLCPASVGCEGDSAPELDFFSIIAGESKGRCTFLSGDGLCEIHKSGHKPIECRSALGCSKERQDIHERVSEAWDTPEGRVVLSRWREEVGL